MADQVYSFGVLGPLLVERDGEPMPLAGGHQRTLLALLLAADAPVPRDRLIDELWGESPPATAGKALSVFLSRLRAQLGEVIVFSAGAYRLEADYELDAARFRSLVASARGSVELELRRDLLAEALELFRGEPLADVESDGIVARWRRGLEQERLEATIARIDCELDLGAGAELVVELEGLLDANPYEERVWGQLMVALARAGRQADALDTYQRVRRLLAYELGIEPGQPLARIQAAILGGGDGWLSGVVPAVVAGDVAPGAGEGAAVGAVPRPLGALIGRADELSELRMLLADRELRLLTLIGGGGVGKTRLALELAHQLQESFVDGAAFVDLGQLADPRLLMTEVAASLGARDGAPPPPVDGLSRTLKGRELLLVLDNFEHLLPAAPAVAALLEAAAGVQVIVTSRAPLRIRGEQLFDVEPLALPGVEDGGSAVSAATELFLERGRAIDRRLQSDPPSMRLITSICRQVDGLPLGIELAAAQLRVLTLAQLDLSMQQPLSLGAQSPRDLPDRQQTLEQTIRWSFNLLTPGARELLLAAGVFRGGFTIEALAAVAGRAPQADLGELLDASLLRRDHEAPRFAMLELVRAFVIAESESNGTRAELRARHRAHFCLVADAVGAELYDGDPRGSLAEQLRPEQANLRAAIDDALAANDGPRALGLVRGMRALWYTGWLVQEGQDVIGRVLDQFDVEPEDELLLLRSASFLDGVSSHVHAQGAFTERLARRAAELGDAASLAVGVANLASLAQNDQDRERVSALKPRLLELVNSDIPVRVRAFLTYTLAVSDYLDGDITGACDRAADGVRLAREADHAYTLAATSLLELMLCSLRDGELARADLVAGFELMQLAPIRPLAPLALWLLARYAAAVDRDAAIHWLAEAERIYQGLDAEMWPESDVRDQAMQALGLTSIPAAESPHVDYLVTIAAAGEWLGARDSGEVARL